MRTSAPGSDSNRPPAAVSQALARGFTLLELLVVVAIIAVATAGVSFALRDSAATQLEREALRLAAVLEAARAQSRGSGVAVRWRAVEGGFRIEGLPEQAAPQQQWLSTGTMVAGNGVLVLGPEPIIAPQAVVLTSSAAPERFLRVATDGLRPFSVSPAQEP